MENKSKKVVRVMFSLGDKYGAYWSTECPEEEILYWGHRFLDDCRLSGGTNKERANQMIFPYFIKF